MLLILAALLDPHAQPRRRATVWLVALVLAYQLPYGLAFSAGTYHFPVLALLLPLAGVGLVAVREGVLHRLLRRPAFLVAVVVLLAIQVQYGYWAVVMR